MIALPYKQPLCNNKKVKNLPLHRKQPELFPLTNVFAIFGEGHGVFHAPPLPSLHLRIREKEHCFSCCYTSGHALHISSTIVLRRQEFDTWDHTL